MKLRVTWWLLVVAGWPCVAGAQLRFLPNQEPQRVFAGGAGAIHLVVSNPGGNNFDAEIRARIFQASSATVVQVGELPWKRLQLLAGQTVLESAQLDFPAVKAETKFLVQWLENTNCIGTTTVWIYPTNLLAELKPLLAGDETGIYDPQNLLKPLLKNLKLDFSDLENSGLENFSGKLAIVGPFQSRAQMRDGLTAQIKALAKHGTAVVWLLPPPAKQDRLLPSFYSVPAGTNAVVVAQAELVSNLPENPQAQMNLISLCKLALKPAPFVLPDSTDNQP